MEVGKCCTFIYTYREREQIVIDYPIESMDNHAIQRYLLFVDSLPVESTTIIIHDYQAMAFKGRSAYKVAVEKAIVSQSTKLEPVLTGQTEVLSAQSAMLTAQSEVMCKLMSRLRTLEHETREPMEVPSYSGAVKQSSPHNKVPAVGQ